MCFDVKNECIKKKVLGMSYEGYFLLGTHKKFIFGEFFLDVNF